MIFMWDDFWRPRWLLIWQIANFSPLTPRQRCSKTPNIQQKILEDTQISKYIQVPACSLGLQIFQIYLSTEAPNYMEKINLTHLYVNIAWKDLFIFTGKNRRTDSPDLLLFSVHALPSLKILLQISKYYSWHKIVGEKKLCKI